VSLTASFLRSKVRQKIICEKSKIYKNWKCSKDLKKNTKFSSKKCLVMAIGGKIWQCQLFNFGSFVKIKKHLIYFYYHVWLLPKLLLKLIAPRLTMTSVNCYFLIFYCFIIIKWLLKKRKENHKRRTARQKSHPRLV
jgi:hypothetical protein